VRDEKHLLEEYRKTGELRLLGKLYEPYMPLLYGVCYRYFNDREKSEDAVMGVFESLIVKLRQHEVTNFKSWLYVFVRNYCLMELRKSKRAVMVELEENMLGEDPGFDQLNEERLTLMEDCLATLSEEQHNCIRLFYLEQHCYQDIAEITGYDMGKVKSYIQNGKRNLKICMEKKTYGK